jgi:hypothetical protein
MYIPLGFSSLSTTFVIVSAFALDVVISWLVTYCRFHYALNDMKESRDIYVEMLDACLVKENEMVVYQRTVSEQKTSCR